MIVLDIAAPILLMLGLQQTNSANASLLNNFEIVATSLIAFFIFKEAISQKLGFAIILVTIASIALSFEGKGSLIVAFLVGEHIPAIMWMLAVLVLEFISYGLSINFYIKAQKDLGAAKTSAYYAISPFLGVAFGMLLLQERPGIQFYIGLVIMIIATVLMIEE